MITDYIRFAFRTFRVRGVRTLLTMMGIFVGIAAIVSLISLGQGLQNAITDQFEQMGTNKLTVSPAGTFFGAGGEAVSEITEDDLDVIKKVRGVKLASGMIFKSAKIEFDDETRYTFVTGMDTGEFLELFKDLANLNIENGRFLKEEDKFKANIGIRLKEADFFDKPINLRDTLKIEGQEFKVIGTYAKIGNPQDDANVYIPLGTAREIFNEPKKLDYIMIETVKGTSIPVAAETIKKRLRDFRNVKEGEEDFNVQTFEELLESFGTILTIVQAVLIGIAGISLLVGGVGIMNTMYTSVLERTNEIGVMKAIGAQNKDILVIFLIESGFLGLMGGIIGVIIGYGIGKLVGIGAAYQGLDILKPSFPWYLIAGALLFAFLVGAISGVAPARQASKMKPVDALRYE